MKSSPFAEGAGPAHLHVTTGSPLAEVFVIDRSFGLVKRGVGTLDTDVEQGVYKIKARLGDVTTEDWHVVNGDLPLDLSDKLSIASPVPLEGTSKTDESHMSLAAQRSREVAMRAGSGAQIFLCARRWSSPGAGGGQPASVLPELSLRRPNGETLVDLAASGRGGPGPGDPMLAATVEVDPGGYLARWRTDSQGAAEQTVVAVRDWQTQVFLLQDADYDDDEIEDRISVLMARDGFTSNDQDLETADQARLALATERVIASQDLNVALLEKFDNPMVGLFGAHLILLAKESEQQFADQAKRGTSDDAKYVRPPVSFDQGFFDHVVGNLADLIGWEHPDVTALATKASNKPLTELAPVDLPPMLWKSWVLLIEASNTRPDLVPVETWRRTVTTLPRRPFLIWSPQEDRAAVKAWEEGVAPLVQPPAPQRDLGGVVRGAPAAERAAPAETQDEARRRLTAQLLAPRAAIDELASD